MLSKQTPSIFSGLYRPSLTEYAMGSSRYRSIRQEYHPPEKPVIHLTLHKCQIGIYFTLILANFKRIEEDSPLYKQVL